MRYIIPFVLLVAVFQASSQDHFKMNFLAQVDTEAKANDIWGFVDGDGIEYAILGTRAETFIYDLTDPSNPVELIRIPGNQTVWRDFKDYNNFIYGTADAGNHGLLVIDMNSPQDSIPWTYYNEEITVGNETDVWGNCHNLYIDTDGLAYFSGCDFNGGGVIIFDLNPDPWIPTYVGSGIQQYSHDNFSRDSIIYSADIGAGTFTIQDVRDLENPILIGEQATTSEKAHNIWPSDDGKYVFTTDETSYGNLDAYDVSDPNNIELLDFYRPQKTFTDPTIPHNTHYLEGYLITSWYTDGIVVVDGNKPDNLVPVAQYDTYLVDNFGFNGCWGAYPYLPSGIILGADIQGGLFVLQPTYERACYLEGTVTGDNSNIINNARVEILDDFETLTSSKSTGNFKTGIYKSGSFDVLFQHPDYYDTIYTVELNHGEVTNLDAIMRAKAVYHFEAIVRNVQSAEGVEGAQIAFVNDEDYFSFITNENGIAQINIREGSYQIYSGAWGYHSIDAGAIEINAQPETVILEVSPGYRDEFLFDFGWELDNTASAGIWEKGEPRGTDIQPDFDLQDDLGDECYVTGNNGNLVYDDDIDDGKTAIISPAIDLSNLENPMLGFSFWFADIDFNYEASDEDSLIVMLEQEGLSDQMLTFSNNHQLEWQKSPKIALNDFSFDPEKEVRIRFSIADVGQANWLEAAIDGFEITDSITTNTINRFAEENIGVYPNPSSTTFKIAGEDLVGKNIQKIELVNISGMIKGSFDISQTGSSDIIFGQELEPGAYTLIFYTPNSALYRKVIKVD